MTNHTIALAFIIAITIVALAFISDKDANCAYSSIAREVQYD